MGVAGDLLFWIIVRLIAIRSHATVVIPLVVIDVWIIRCVHGNPSVQRHIHWRDTPFEVDAATADGDREDKQGSENFADR